jgi:hypothetical protein
MRIYIDWSFQILNTGKEVNSSQSNFYMVFTFYKCSKYNLFSEPLYLEYLRAFKNKVQQTEHWRFKCRLEKVKRRLNLGNACYHSI